MNRWIFFLLASALVCTQAAQKIRGTPGVDYPDYPSIPKTSFKCSNQKYIPGFYADTETQCQVFHFCFDGRQESFLCPAGTTFNQAVLTCDSWFNSNCSMASKFHGVNAGPAMEVARKNIQKALKLNGGHVQISTSMPTVFDKISMYQHPQSSPESEREVNLDEAESVLNAENEAEENSEYSEFSEDENLDLNEGPQMNQNYEEYGNENQWEGEYYPDDIQSDPPYDETREYNRYDQSLDDDWEEPRPSKAFEGFYEGSDKAAFMQSYKNVDDGTSENEEIYYTESPAEADVSFGSEEVYEDPTDEFSKRSQSNRRRKPQYIVIEDEPEKIILPDETDDKEESVDEPLPETLEELSTQIPLEIKSEAETRSGTQIIEIPDEPQDSQERDGADFESTEYDSDIKPESKDSMYAEDGTDNDILIYNDETDVEAEGSKHFYEMDPVSSDIGKMSRQISEPLDQAQTGYVQKGLDETYVVIPDETDIPEQASEIESGTTPPGDEYEYMYRQMGVEGMPQAYARGAEYENIYRSEQGLQMQNDKGELYDPANYYRMQNYPYPYAYAGMNYPGYYQVPSYPSQQIPDAYVPQYPSAHQVPVDPSQYAAYSPVDGYQTEELVTQVPDIQSVTEAGLEPEAGTEFPVAADPNEYGSPYNYEYYVPNEQEGYSSYYQQSGYVPQEAYGEQYVDENAKYETEEQAFQTEESSAVTEEELTYSTENYEETADIEEAYNAEPESENAYRESELTSMAPESAFDPSTEVPEGLIYDEKESDESLYDFDLDSDGKNTEDSGTEFSDLDAEQLGESSEQSAKTGDSVDGSEDLSFQDNVDELSSKDAPAASEDKVDEIKGNDTVQPSKEEETSKTSESEYPAETQTGFQPSKSKATAKQSFVAPTENEMLNSMMFPNQMNFNPYLYGTQMGQFGMMDSNSGSLGNLAQMGQGQMEATKLSSIQEKLKSMKRGKFGMFKKFMINQ